MGAPGVLEVEQAERMASLMRAIGHSVRLRVLSLLRQGEANVTRISECLGVSQAVVSNQLSILRMNGLVEVRRAQGFAWYRLNEARVRDVLRCISGEGKPAASDPAGEAG